MTGPAHTDRSRAIEATEFLWDGAADPESHGYLAHPVIELLRSHGAREVLDLGCGNGAFTARLHAAGFAATGMDHSLSGLEIARRSCPAAAFEQVDLSAGLPDSCRGRFDAVVCLEVIEHLLLPRRLLRGAVDSLRPGGLLVLSTPYHGYLKNLAIALAGGFDRHWHPLRDYGHVKFFSPATLGELMREFELEDIRLRTAGRIPPLAKSMIASARKP